ncbi:MAG: hypothetical protein R2795_26390 [Saprospiraceae bacterium]
MGKTSPLFLDAGVIHAAIWHHEWAARLPNALCGLLTLVFLFHIGKRWVSTTFGWWWVALYTAFSWVPHFLFFKSGIIDPWFNLFILRYLLHDRKQATASKRLVVHGS